MKVVILAGGFGTRLSEHTKIVPKPMVTIGGIPMICHVMEIYSRHGYNDFVLALGYKAEVIKEYFLNYSIKNSDFHVCLKTGKVEVLQPSNKSWKVTLVDTGLDTMTGGRIKRLKPYLNDNPFMITYGDGVSNVDITKINEQHKRDNNLLTITAVRPNARFGELELNCDKVESFREKSQLDAGWINGGFMVAEPSFLDLIENDKEMLEREPFDRVVEMNKMGAYRHEGFWQCMDTKREREILEELYKKNPLWS